LFEFHDDLLFNSCESLSLVFRIWCELSIGAFLEDHIGSLPGLIIDQSPFMT
jgi:hypothetical protein